MIEMTLRLMRCTLKWWRKLWLRLSRSIGIGLQEVNKTPYMLQRFHCANFNQSWRFEFFLFNIRLKALLSNQVIMPALRSRLTI